VDVWGLDQERVTRLGDSSACPVECCLPFDGRHLGLLTAHDLQKMRYGAMVVRLLTGTNLSRTKSSDLFPITI
jgi:hypothetical protein